MGSLTKWRCLDVFVANVQQKFGKGVAETSGTAVLDCVDLVDRYVRSRSQGGQPAVFFNVGMGQGTLSFSINPDPLNF